MATEDHFRDARRAFRFPDEVDHSVDNGIPLYTEDLGDGHGRIVSVLAGPVEIKRDRK